MIHNSKQIPKISKFFSLSFPNCFFLFSANDITDYGAAEILQSLKTFNFSIQNLELSGNSKITEPVLSEISNILNGKDSKNQNFSSEICLERKKKFIDCLLDGPKKEIFMQSLKFLSKVYD